MNMYEAIYSRKSVRKYRMEPFPAEMMTQFRRFLDSIAPLDGQSRVKLEIFDALREKEKVRGLWSSKAPYYLLVYCDGTQAGFRSAGYMAEQAVLYLTTKEAGTCYLGASRVGEQEKGGLKQMLIIAFGPADGRPWRDSLTARRLPLNSLCVYKDEPGENVKAILKAARLAPSSFNSQPWRFVVYSDRIYVFARKTAAVGRKLGAAMREFNIGIMLSHIMLAAEEYWMNMETVTEDQFVKKAYKNGDYVCTIVFHS